MKALVTGGAGLVGSHLVDLLLERGWEVVVLDNLEPVTHAFQTPPVWVPRDVEFIWGDVRDDDSVGKAMAGADVVFHQAAYGGFTPEHSKVTDVNCVGTSIVMNEARNAGVRKVVVASSQAVYGNGQYRPCPTHGSYPQWPRLESDLERGIWDHQYRCCVGSPPVGHVPLREDHPVHLTTTYARSKLYAERLALALGGEWGLPVVALRYGLTYGPRQSLTNPYTGIISLFANQILAGEPCRVYEDGQQLRDFTYVGDVAAANLLVMEKPVGERVVAHGADHDNEGGRTFGSVLNVGTGIGTSVIDFVEILSAEMGMPFRAELGGYRRGDARHLVTDARALFGWGWTPKVDVREGIRRYVEWRTA
jgi:dTDP-L-rhamnose 4-epimerase